MTAEEEEPAPTGEAFMARFFRPELVSPPLPPRDGRVVVPAPRPRHRCQPGVTYREVPPGDPDSIFAGMRLPVLPDGLRYPPGTVWQCGCGRLWRAYAPVRPDRGVIAAHPLAWRRVGWWGRWRRPVSKAPR